MTDSVDQEFNFIFNLWISKMKMLKLKEIERRREQVDGNSEREYEIQSQTVREWERKIKWSQPHECQRTRRRKERRKLIFIKIHVAPPGPHLTLMLKLWYRYYFHLYIRKVRYKQVSFQRSQSYGRQSRDLYNRIKRDIFSPITSYWPSCFIYPSLLP